MKLPVRSTISILMVALFALYGFTANAQSSNQTKTKDKTACVTTTGGKKSEACASTASTSGCKPSSCRGAKTKFGEAKVISNLRNELIALKAKMEQSKTPKFEARSYDLHGIVGKSDDESIDIIIKEVKLIEKDFNKNSKYTPVAFDLPQNKAKQIQYLSDRIEALKALL